MFLCPSIGSFAHWKWKSRIICWVLEIYLSKLVAFFLWTYFTKMEKMDVSCSFQCFFTKLDGNLPLGPSILFLVHVLCQLVIFSLKRGKVKYFTLFARCLYPNRWTFIHGLITQIGWKKISFFSVCLSVAWLKILI